MNHGAQSPRTCSIAGCGKPHRAYGWCTNHYGRWRRHGDPLKGATSHDAIPNWINDVAILFEDKSLCLTWPFGRYKNGYGQMTSDGKKAYAHRVICEMVNGPPPTEKHEAAHSCGQGHEACVNPNHLSWKTRKDNHADKLLHGTMARGEKHGQAKLTESDVLRIRSLSGMASHSEIAENFGVTRSVVTRIINRQSWSWI